jgi:hypothetical protein
VVFSSSEQNCRVVFTSPLTRVYFFITFSMRLIKASIFPFHWVFFRITSVQLSIFPFHFFFEQHRCSSYVTSHLLKLLRLSQCAQVTAVRGLINRFTALVLYLHL